MSTPSTSEAARDPEALGPVEVRAAYEVVAQRLRRAIHLGTLGPGDLLPPERELAAQLGVSRVTVREALRTLQGAGYVKRRRGATNGTEVASPSPEATTLRAELLGRMGEIDAVCEFRAIIEAGAARLAAVSWTREALDAVLAAVDELDAVTTVGAFRRADGHFHLRIARMAGNAPLERAITDAREQMFAPIDAQPYTLMVERTRRNHMAIHEAIAAGEPERAGRLMAVHVRASHVELREALGLV